MKEIIKFVIDGIDFSESILLYAFNTEHKELEYFKPYDLYKLIEKINKEVKFDKIPLRIELSESTTLVWVRKYHHSHDWMKSIISKRISFEDGIK